MNWYFDTSVLVAAAIAKHPHHAPAARLLEALACGPHRGFLSSHGLAEVYSVLTRLPLTPRIYPNEANQIIEDQILPLVELVALTGEEYKEIVRQAGRKGWVGGRIHDAIHLRCAAKMDCDLIYTFNFADFRALASPELAARVAVP